MHITAQALEEDRDTHFDEAVRSGLLPIPNSGHDRAWLLELLQAGGDLQHVRDKSVLDPCSIIEVCDAVRAIFTEKHEPCSAEEVRNALLDELPACTTFSFDKSSIEDIGTIAQGLIERVRERLEGADCTQ